MKALEATRGYVSERYPAEAKAVKQLLGHGYTPEEIVACYHWLKQQPWWRDKGLYVMTVAAEIGEWKKRQGGNDGANRGHLEPSRPAERRAITPDEIQQHAELVEWERAVLAGEIKGLPGDGPEVQRLFERSNR